MRALAVSAAAALLVAGCAKLPEHISESYVSDVYYQTLSCQELGAARSPVQREYNRLAREQTRFRGVLIPPRAAKSNADRIAAYKGMLAAIERAQGMNDCLPPA